VIDAAPGNGDCALYSPTTVAGVLSDAHAASSSASKVVVTTPVEDRIKQFIIPRSTLRI